MPEAASCGFVGKTVGIEENTVAPSHADSRSRSDVITVAALRSLYSYSPRIVRLGVSWYQAEK